MKKIIISDVTLRDGNHAVNHSINLNIVKQYCQFAEKAKLSVVEVGHGNGIGASSLSIGRSAFPDKKILKTARKFLKQTKLSIHSIPGFSTINDLQLAIDEGVDIFRIGCNSTEIDIIEKQVNFCNNNKVEVWGVLMMFHLIMNNKEYIKKINFLKSLGLKTVILMDSAGCLLPSEVKKIFFDLKKIKINLGFHAHNNLGLGVSNALSALHQGATLIDGASMGLGAGAGNAQLENIVAAGNRENSIYPGIFDFLQMSKLVEDSYPDLLPRTTSSSTQSGLVGVFSGYAPQVLSISEELGLDSNTLWREMANRKLVAGQESMIREIAQDLMNL
jgi:4-hydroxy 2-oxovalerate aldolase